MIGSFLEDQLCSNIIQIVDKNIPGRARELLRNQVPKLGCQIAGLFCVRNPFYRYFIIEKLCVKLDECEIVLLV